MTVRMFHVPLSFWACEFSPGMFGLVDNVLLLTFETSHNTAGNWTQPDTQRLMWLLTLFYYMMFLIERGLVVLVAALKAPLSITGSPSRSYTQGHLSLPRRNNFHSSSVLCPVKDRKQLFSVAMFKKRCDISSIRNEDVPLLSWAYWYAAWSYSGLFWMWFQAVPGTGSSQPTNSEDWGEIRSLSWRQWQDVTASAFLCSYVLAAVFLEGMPSNTMTLSAK